jgi:hypothetical protein
MQIAYDFFFLLLLSYYPETKEPLSQNMEFVGAIKDNNLVTTCKCLGIKTASQERDKQKKA